MKNCLVIVDLQNAFINENTAHLPHKIAEFISSHDCFDKMYFCGVNTDCCVLATVFSCYDSVQDCAVISDLCASTLGEEKHRNAIELLKDNITAERVVESCNIP